MKKAKAKPKTVTAYINSAPKGAQTKLREMRSCIRAAAPGATEGLKWGMPAFSTQRILVTYGAFAHHIGFYPTAAAVDAFAAELSGYVTARGTIQFPLDKPLPRALIRRITAFRVRESETQGGKWRT